MTTRKHETGLRPIAMLAASLLVWAVAMVVAVRVLRTEPESTLLRAAMVALGAGGFLAWIVSVARLVMTQDEFSQRIHFVAIALTCAATAVLLMLGDLLQTAGFLGYVPLQGIWMAMGVVWWLAIVVATWSYR
jgi:hypothetical protein